MPDTTPPAVNWADLYHAYGSAEDTPPHLHALEFGDETAREEALAFLFGSVLHQGTIYPATAPVVTHLIGLLERERTPNPEALLGFLGAVGNSAFDAAQAFEFDLFGDPDIMTDEYLQSIVLAQHALLAGTPVYLRLLEHEDEEVRVWACLVPKACTANLETIESVMRSRLLVEEASRVRLGMVFALATLWQRRPDTAQSAERAAFLRTVALDEGESPGTRLMATGGVLRTLGVAALPDMQELIAAHLEAGQEEIASMPQDEHLYYWSVFQALEGEPDALCGLLLGLLEHPSEAVRDTAWWQLQATARTSRSVAWRATPVWVAALSDPARAEEALNCLGEFPEAAREAVEPLLEALERNLHAGESGFSMMPGPSEGAALALARLSEPKAVQILVGHLGNPRELLHVLAALRAFGPVAAPAVPALLELFDGLETIGKPTFDDEADDPQDGLGEVREAMRNGWDLITDQQFQDVIRMEVMRTLAEIGPAAREAIPRLQHLFTTRWPKQHWQELMVIHHTLRSIDPTAIPVALLLEAFEHGDRSGLLVSMLGSCGLRAVAALPKLRSMLHEGKEHERWQVVTSLIALGEDPNVVQPVLEAFIRDALHAERHKQSAAASGLNLLLELHAIAPTVLPLVVQALKHDWPEVRVAAARVHARITGDAGLALQTVMAALRQQPTVEYVEVLPEFGAQAKEAIPLLRSLLESDQRVKGDGRGVEGAAYDDLFCQRAVRVMQQLEQMDGLG